MLPVLNGQLTNEGTNTLLAYKFPELYNPDLENERDIYANTPISALKERRDNNLINGITGGGTSIVSSIVRANILKDMNIGTNILKDTHMPLGYRVGLNISQKGINSFNSITTAGAKLNINQKAFNNMGNLPTGFKRKYMGKSNQYISAKSKTFSLSGLSSFILPHQGGLGGALKTFGFWNFIAGDPRDLTENTLMGNLGKFGMHYGMGMAGKAGKNYIGRVLHGKLETMLFSNEKLLSNLGFQNVDEFKNTLSHLNSKERRTVVGRIASRELQTLRSKGIKIGTNLYSDSIRKTTKKGTKGIIRRVGSSITDKVGKLINIAYGTGESEAALLANSSARTAMLNRIGIIGGQALRATNIVSGVISAGQVIDAAVGYVRDYEKQFLSGVTNFDTAYRPLELGGVTGTEQQRALEAMQNSQLNVRGMLGNEAGMLHSI